MRYWGWKLKLHWLVCFTTSPMLHHRLTRRMSPLCRSGHGYRHGQVHWLPSMPEVNSQECRMSFDICRTVKERRPEGCNDFRLVQVW